jgi:hypothetical protein
METNDKNMTTTESLDLITSMINQAQRKVKDVSKFFLLWGWVVILANVSMYLLILMEYPRPYLAWLLVIPAWLFSFYLAAKTERQREAVTHLDKVITSLWLSFAALALTLVFFGSKINFQLNPVILLLTAIPTFVTGIIIKFRPLVSGSIVFWVFGIVGFLLPFEYQNLTSAVAFIFGYLIPGYMLKGKSRR